MQVKLFFKDTLYRWSQKSISAMSTKARKRILRDYKDYLRNKPMGITCRIHEDNMMIWDACILGQTILQPGNYFVDLLILLGKGERFSYVLSCPRNIRMWRHRFAFSIVSFTQIVWLSSRIGISSLCGWKNLSGHSAESMDAPVHHSYRSAFNSGLDNVFGLSQSLLNDPNPASPANQHASSIYCHSKETFWIFVYLIGSYNEMVRECVVRSWLSPAAVKECFPEEGRS